MRFLNGQQRTVVYVLLWVGLLWFGFVQRSRIAKMQEQVDQDLELISTRRAAIQSKLETIAEKERVIISREQGSACCVEKSAAQARAHSFESKISDLEQQASKCRQEQGLLAQKVMDLEKQLANLTAHHSSLPKPSVSAALGGPPLDSGLHAHGAHTNVAPAVVLPQLSGKSVRFQVNTSFVAPPFLEPLASEWGFMRDSSNPIGFLTLMPFPKSVDFGKEFVTVDAPTVSVEWSQESEFAKAAVSRFQKRLASLVANDGLARCALHDLCTWAVPVKGNALHVSISCDEAAPTSPVTTPDESYKLKIEKSGHVTIVAKQAVGVVRALSTLLQLATKYSPGAFMHFPVVTIEDAPVYRWRGFLLDVSRHFHPVELVMQVLDGMEAVKLNVLHWHLSDDQGFRVEIRSLPELHRKGSDGLFYTHEQIESVVRAAALRGIRVVPEIDMPAHVGAVLLAYPDLASGSVPSRMDSTWGQRPWVLDPSKPKVLEWIATLLKEMTTLFPDEYFHIGGDEVPQSSWAELRGGEFMKQNNLRSLRDIQLHFNKYLCELLGSLGRKMIGWDEITVDWLPKNVTVQLWRGWLPDVAEQVSRLGLPSITSSELYLDWVKSVKHYYKHDVRPRQNRIGAEACMWSEWASDNVDNRIWPTLAAIAEKLWLSTEAHGGVDQM